MKLDDQFEWDLENPDADPELFAEIYAQDLGLGGEFKYVQLHRLTMFGSICIAGPLLHTLFASTWLPTKNHFS